MNLIPHEINEDLCSFIGGWYIDDKLCDEIVACHTEVENSGHASNINHPRNYLVSEFLSYPKEIVEEYLKSLYYCHQQYTTLYPASSEKSIGIYGLVNGINVQHYLPNNFYDAWHTERTNSHDFRNRHLVFMTYLNDIDVGGKTLFFHQKISIQPCKGLTIIWPSEWTHLHSGSSTNEHKYVITGWWAYLTGLHINLEHFKDINEK